MKHITSCLLVVAAFCLVACSDVQMVRHSKTEYPPVETVALLENPPHQRYEVIASLSTYDNEAAVDQLRQKAADIGADAIFIHKAWLEKVNATDAPGILQATSVHWLEVRAIRYK